MRLIKFIDVPGHEETLQIIPVKHTSASEIAKLLDKILKDDTSKKVRSSRSSTNAEVISKITAEPRTNSIIAMANADGAKRLRGLIQRLDVKLIAGNNEQIHVYYLFHGDAEELAKTLSTLVSGSKPATTSRRTRRSRFSSSSSSEANSLFNAEVRVTADKSNNALVITASPTDWLTMEKVIKKLDVPKDQVFVEGLIMETNVNKNRDVGVSIIGAYGTGGADRAGFLGGESGGILQQLVTNQWQSIGGLFAGVGLGGSVETTINGQEITIDSVNALITAISGNSDTNVLATPQLLVQDNTEGVFEVGETVPVPTTSTATNGTTSTSLTDKNVTLTMKITPQINKVTRYIKMKIDQKIDDFSSRSLPSGLASEGIATNTRSTVTTVTVRDRDTIAMGGLMRDKTVDNETKVPLLGDIPVLGWLFKNKKSTVEKVNMLFFLTPRILSNYQKDVAETVKDGLNRRAAHLKGVYGEEDPFGTTAKGLYEKAKKQEAGPLYDENETKMYKDQEGIEGTILDEDDLGQVPNYKKIQQLLKTKKSSVKKVKVTKPQNNK